MSQRQGGTKRRWRDIILRNSMPLVQVHMSNNAVHIESLLCNIDTLSSLITIVA